MLFKFLFLNFFLKNVIIHVSPPIKPSFPPPTEYKLGLSCSKYVDLFSLNVLFSQFRPHDVLRIIGHFTVVGLVS